MQMSERLVESMDRVSGRCSSGSFLSTQTSVTSITSLSPRGNAAFDTSSITSSNDLTQISNPSCCSFPGEMSFQVMRVDRKMLIVKESKKSSLFAEELSLAAARLINVQPVAANLFAIWNTKDSLWLPPGRSVSQGECVEMGLELRIRFLCHLDLLSKTDPPAMDYLFFQCRQDFLDGRINEFLDEQNDKILASAKGLAVLDMLRVMKEKNQTADQVMKTWQKRFLPPDLLKRSIAPSNVAQRLKNSLLNKLATKHLKEILEERALQHDTKSVPALKKQFVEFLLSCAPSYICEEFSCRLGVNIKLPMEKVRVNAMESEISLERMEERKWRPFSPLSDICDISLILDKFTCQINRLSGPPLCFRFANLPEMESFVALVDGYFRFSHRFYFNLCHGVTTPSLQELKADKCHGPMERDVLYEKLLGKPHGTFTVCQSTDMYGVYRIDMKDRDVCRSFIIDSEEIESNVKDGQGPSLNFHLRNSTMRFGSLSALLTYYSTPHDGLFLKNCLRPSENEVVGLRLFPPKAPKNGAGYPEIYDAATPLCISPTHLTYKQGSTGGKSIHGFHSTIRQATLRLSEKRMIDVSVKIFSPNLTMESTQKLLSSLQSFIHVANPSMLVRCYGLLLSPLSLITEHFPYGSLQVFLKENAKSLSLRNLLDVGTQVAKTLWWLEEQGTPYWPVSLRKVFVVEFNGTSIKVKLACLGLSESVHWRGLNNEDTRDTWAFATFLWQLFALGIEPLSEIDQDEAESLYRNGYRLEKPFLCPEEVYELMQKCWSSDPDQRPELAEILREMNQILVQFYDATSPIQAPPENGGGDGDHVARKESKVEFLLRVTGNCLMQNINANMNLSRKDYGNQITNAEATGGIAYDPWLIDESSLKIIERLGEGRYGEVNKALYTDPLSDEEPKLVAVKQLKQMKCDNRSAEWVMDEMRSEMEIMKSLQHGNIVETVGMVLDPMPLLVMEFIPNGSLCSYLHQHNGDLSTGQLLQFATDVACGMTYLQGKEIVHRDLAARNILVSSELHAKISDFGLARFLDTGGYYLTQNYGRSIPLAWYAPEVIEFHKYSSKSDCWSYGVLLWEMFSFAQPPYFCDLSVLAEKLREGMRLPQPAACPPEVYAVMHNCWQYEAVKRPDFALLYRTMFDLLQQHS